MVGRAGAWARARARLPAECFTLTIGANVSISFRAKYYHILINISYRKKTRYIPSFIG